MKITSNVFTDELRNYVSALEEVMIQKGYSECYINVCNKVWQTLIKYADAFPKQEFTESFRNQFLLEIYDEKLERRDEMYRITRSMNILSDYIYFHVIFRQYCTPKTEFSKELGRIFVDFLTEEKKRNFSQETEKQLRARLMRFHDYLYDIGIHDANLISGEIINTYILSLARFSTTYVSETLREMKRLFIFAYQNKYVDNSLDQYIPRVKNIRQQKIPSTFSVDEINSIIASIERNNPIGKRNYAIFLIAARLGIRGSDIRSLTFSNIDWDQKTVSFSQQKTGHLLKLPLPDDVGWAIIDYLKNGRPQTDSKNIFVSHNYPYMQLSSISKIVPAQMRKAGIKSPNGRRIGMHAFRHGLATHMLEKNIPLPVISQTLGHADIKSTEVYLRISIAQLSQCALEVDI